MIKKNILCINHDCSKKAFCRRYVSRPLPDDCVACYQEIYHRQPCSKYMPNSLAQESQETYINIDTPATGRAVNNEDAELREYLVSMVQDNFDDIFMKDLAWRSGEAYHVTAISGKIVDLLLPAIKRNVLSRKRK